MTRDLNCGETEQYNIIRDSSRSVWGGSQLLNTAVCSFHFVFWKIKWSLFIMRRGEIFLQRHPPPPLTIGLMLNSRTKFGVFPNKDNSKTITSIIVL